MNYKKITLYPSIELRVTPKEKISTTYRAHTNGRFYVKQITV